MQTSSMPGYAQAITFPDSAESPAQEPLELHLANLYSRELQDNPSHDYLREHSSPEHLSSHVAMFRWYWPWIEGSRSVLDWGCQHGPDSAMLRHAHNLADTSGEVSIDGCDLADGSDHPHFRAAAQMTYRSLESIRSLPYDDGQFDAVIAAGVLEHVASDVDSLRELHRILQPGGRLVVTFLPNVASLDEYRLRRRGLPHHERLYSRRATRQMLLHSGFRPLTPVFYQTPAWRRQVAQVLKAGARAEWFTRALRTLAPIHVVRASTLCVVAERASGFT